MSCVQLFVCDMSSVGVKPATIHLLIGVLTDCATLPLKLNMNAFDTCRSENLPQQIVKLCIRFPLFSNDNPNFYKIQGAFIALRQNV